MARAAAGTKDKLRLGNLEARRDWGHAGEYVQAMWLMLQQDKPDDYVVATGETHSVREFLEIAFSCANLDYHDFVAIDPAFYRPSEVLLLQGDPTKAKRVLGWSYNYTFKDLIGEMVEADIKNISSLWERG